MKVNKQPSNQSENVFKLHDEIVEGIKDKKGLDIISIDLRKIQDAITDFFIICHGESTTQVKAIGENIEKTIKDKLGEYVGHREGYDNLEWVLLDYFNIVVHIFLKDRREYYKLEELWNDAPHHKYDDQSS